MMIHDDLILLEINDMVQPFLVFISGCYHDLN